LKQKACVTAVMQAFLWLNAVFPVRRLEAVGPVVGWCLQSDDVTTSATFNLPAGLRPPDRRVAGSLFGGLDQRQKALSLRSGPFCIKEQKAD
jgi:hypothetical protein